MAPKDPRTVGTGERSATRGKVGSMPSGPEHVENDEDSSRLHSSDSGSLFQLVLLRRFGTCRTLCRGIRNSTVIDSQYRLHHRALDLFDLAHRQIAIIELPVQ